MSWLFDYSILWDVGILFLLIAIFFGVCSKVNKVMPKNEQEKMEKNEYVLKLIDEKTSLIRIIKWFVVVLYTGYTLFEMYRDCNSGSMFSGLITDVFIGPFLLLGETVVGGRLVCNLYNFIYYAIRSLREKNLSYLFVYNSLFKMSGKGILICLVMIGVMVMCYMGLSVFFSNVDFCKMF